MNKKNKICFFCGNIERSGGTERVTTLIANELKLRGYDVIVLSYEGGRKSFFPLEDNIKLYTLMENDNMNKIKKQVYPSYLLYKFIKKEKVDLIIDVDILLSIHTIPLKLFSDIKIISWEHFNINNNNGVKKRDRARRLASIFSDKVIVLNKYDMKNYQRRFNKINNIDYIYNPCSFKVQEDISTNKRNVVLSVGRLTNVKGFDLLLDAWKYVELETSDWTLEIVGSGEEHDKLKNKIIDLEFKNVNMIPFSDNIKEYYKEASIYAMSSRFEGFPMVLLEAQSFGLPIVSFDCETGPREIIRNNVDGVLVKNGDVEELGREILKLINDPIRLKDYSIKAKENSKKFTLDVSVDKWEEILELI